MQITSLQAKKIIYSDFDITFSKHPDRGDLNLLTNEEAVKQSIKNILFTNRYERVRKQELAGDLNRLLFEPADQITESLMRDTISSAINIHEPRAKLLGVTVKSDPDNHSFNVTVEFYIINISQPITLNVILRRVR